MVFPGVKIKAYQIRRNVYQLYKIRLHAMTSHPGARPIDDVGRDRPGAQQTLVATPTLTMVVPLPHHDADLLLYRSSVAWRTPNHGHEMSRNYKIFRVRVCTRPAAHVMACMPVACASARRAAARPADPEI